jgi:hypothetical protein
MAVKEVSSSGIKAFAKYGNMVTNNLSYSDFFLTGTQFDDTNITYYKTVITDAADGSVYQVSHVYNSSSSKYELYVSKFDSDLNYITSKKISDSSSIRSLSNIVVSPTNGYLIIAASIEVSVDKGMLIAIAGDLSSIVWAKFFSHTYGSESGNQNSSVTVDNSGNLFFASGADTNYVYDYGFLAKINSLNGSTTWKKYFGSLGDYGLKGRPMVTTDSSGNVYWASIAQERSPNTLSVVKLNSSGSFLWGRKVEEEVSRNSNIDENERMKIDPSGNLVFLLGTDTSNTRMNIVRLDSSNGALVSAIKVQTPTTGSSFGMNLDSDGNLYANRGNWTMKYLPDNTNEYRVYFSGFGIPAANGSIFISGKFQYTTFIITASSETYQNMPAIFRMPLNAPDFSNVASLFQQNFQTSVALNYGAQEAITVTSTSDSVPVNSASASETTLSGLTFGTLTPVAVEKVGAVLD